MRKSLLFRAKGVEPADKNHWYEGYYYRCDDTTYCFKEDYDGHPEITHHYILFDQMTDWGLPNQHMRADINPDTLCQCTGIRDSNHRMIWEHDIVRTTNTINDHVTWYVCRWRDEVGGLVFTDPMEYMYNNMNAFHDRVLIEVMGNEIENPELLENIESLTPDEFMEKLDREFKAWKKNKEEVKLNI